MDYLSWFPERIAELRIQKDVSGFLYICEYLNITPQQFFDTDARTPARARELQRQLERLTPAQAEHILQVVRDLGEKN